MDRTLIAATFLIGTLGALLACFFRRLFSPQATLPPSTDWIEDLSANRYLPMERLLSDEDADFLASQPRFRGETMWRFRRERRKIFRGYLQCLKQDFERASTALQMMIIQSTYDRPELGMVLLRQKAIFQAALLGVQVRLLMHACGWNQVVDLQTLGASLDVLSLELRRMIAPRMVRAASAA